MKEPFLSEEEHLMTRALGVCDEGAALARHFLKRSANHRTVFESGHPRASTSDDSKSSPVDCVAASRTKRNNIE